MAYPDSPKQRYQTTALIWPGKYNEDGSLKEVPRVNLPFQIIETINGSRASQEAKPEEMGQEIRASAQ